MHHAPGKITIPISNNSSLGSGFGTVRSGFKPCDTFEISILTNSFKEEYI